MNPQKTYKLDPLPERATLVLHCVDLRLRNAFRAYLEDRGVHTPIRLAIPGGVHDVVAAVPPKGMRVLNKHIDWEIEKLHVGHVILFGHEDCKWYRGQSALVPGTIEQNTINHLKLYKKILEGRHKDITVECVIARVDGTTVTFDAIP